MKNIQSNDNLITSNNDLFIERVDGKFLVNGENQFDDISKVLQKVEFEDSLRSSFVVEFFLSKTKEELSSQFGDIIANMVGYDQNNPHHCYDLWEHTLNVVEGISPEGISDDDFLTLRIAAFFHDIGKPEMAKKKDNRTTFAGHPKKSAELASPILKKLGYSDTQISRISFFIEHHDDFKNLTPFTPDAIISKYDKELNIDNLTNIIFDNEKKILTTGSYLPTLNDYNLLIKLCISDVSAQSRVVFIDGVIVNSRSNKINKLQEVEILLPTAYENANQKSIFLLQNNMKTDSGIDSFVKKYANSILSGAKLVSSTPLQAETTLDETAILDLENVLHVYGFKSEEFNKKLTAYVQGRITNSKIKNYMNILASRQHSFAINIINHCYENGSLTEVLKLGAFSENYSPVSSIQDYLNSL